MRRLLILLALVLQAGLPQTASADTQEFIVPAVLNGYVNDPVHNQTIIRIVNLSVSPVEVTFEAYTNQGIPIRVFELFPVARSGTKTVFQIAPLGAVEAFTAEDVPSLHGWARLTADASADIQVTAEVALINAPVGPHPICHRPSTEIVTSVQLVAVKAAKEFAGFAVIRPNRKSAYAIVNPSPGITATVSLSLLDGSGELVDSVTVRIPPQGQADRVLADVFRDAPADLMGSLRIVSDTPIGVGAVNVLYPEGRFTSLPVSALTPRACVQVLTPAKNPLTGECRLFPTPCDVPPGWEPVAACIN